MHPQNHDFRAEGLQFIGKPRTLTLYTALIRLADLRLQTRSINQLSAKSILDITATERTTPCFLSGNNEVRCDTVAGVPHACTKDKFVSDWIRPYLTVLVEITSRRSDKTDSELVSGSQRPNRQLAPQTTFETSGRLGNMANNSIQPSIIPALRWRT